MPGTRRKMGPRYEIQPSPPNYPQVHGAHSERPPGEGLPASTQSPMAGADSISLRDFAGARQREEIPATPLHSHHGRLGCCHRPQARLTRYGACSMGYGDALKAACLDGPYATGRQRPIRARRAIVSLTATRSMARLPGRIVSVRNLLSFRLAMRAPMTFAFAHSVASFAERRRRNTRSGHALLAI
jgi:hypothetical protein